MNYYFFSLDTLAAHIQAQRPTIGAMPHQQLFTNGPSFSTAFNLSNDKFDQMINNIVGRFNNTQMR